MTKGPTRQYHNATGTSPDAYRKEASGCRTSQLGEGVSEARYAPPAPECHAMISASSEHKVLATIKRAQEVVDQTDTVFLNFA